MPAVTVVMPVYNGARYLREAIDSILGQTFRDFELLIINDGSTDDSAAVAASYPDPRIRLISNDTNRGLVFTANRGLETARGSFIAIMHSDDIALPNRLERQVRFLEANPRVGVVGSWYERFGSESNVIRPPTDHDNLAATLLFQSPFGHPTVMLRARVLRETGHRYAASEFPLEDWGLWTRLARVTRLANVPEVLLRYRVHATSVTGTQGAQTGASSRTVLGSRALYAEMLPRLGIHPTPAELDLHTALCFSLPALTIAEAEAWLRRLLVANRKTRVYPELAFNEVVGWMWLRASFHRPGGLAEKTVRWVGSPLVRHAVRAVVRNPRATIGAFLTQRAQRSAGASA